MKKFPRVIKFVVCMFCVLSLKTVYGQNVGISSSGSFTPDASAGLDVSYANKGLLIPRVALTATNAAGPITTPATSLLVYNTATAGTSPNNVIPGYYYWNGTAWNMLTTSTQAANFWATTGNAGTNYQTNFLGTTDNQSLRFRTNNTQRFLLDSLGNAAIGLSPTFSSNIEKLLVDAGTTSSFNVISGKGNINNYLQLNIQNSNAGTTASSDVVATADNGSETVNYVDMGINSSANTAAFFGAANDAYLYNAGGTVGGNFFIGTSTSGKALGFMTGGGATTNERMRIDGTGNVGIGTTTPTQKLDIAGNLRFSGALMPNNNAGTAGYLLMSNGSGVAPTWFNAATAAWATTGNTGTTAGTNFLGTIDAKDFVIKTNNTERTRISSSGDFSIGSTAFNSTNPEQLLVDAGTTSSFNVISGKGNINNYLQLNIQNTNAGTAASSDVVATADNGSETTNYVDMGINSSANTAAFFGAANDAYLYNVGGSVGGNFFIGTSSSGKALGFMTGGGATANERMRIDGSGNVGIGTTAPATKLHIVGTNPLTLNGVQTGTNTSTDSLLTLSSGLVRKLPIATFASAASWSTTGNTGTTAGTNFIGTTDANDMVFKANNVERMRIVNGTSSTTGTTGDITIGDANSGTLRSTKELVLRQDGDTGGQTTLRLRNRAGQNGAVFETTGAANNLVDFIFNTGTVSSPISSNIRFETRSSSIKVSGNTTEWQFGQPDVTNGGPTLVVGASGTGSNSAIRTGNFGIGTTSPATKLHVFGANPLTLSGVVTGTSTSADSLLTITSGLVRKLPISTFASPASWSTTGNAGTNYRTNYLGTTDNQSLRFRTNNAQRFLLDSLGNAAVGLAPAFNASNPEKLLVDAGTTSSFNVISGKGNINNYLQLNIQNNNAGTAASSDVVATADNGTESVNYVDMGINSSANTAAYFGAANDAYLYNAGGSVGGNFFIGTSTSGKVLGFMTGGGATTNERMRIDGSGNVGIGNTAPSQKLDVNGTIVSSATTYPNYAYNTANRMAFGETNVPANETGSVVQYGSGSNTRNMVFAFSKTNVNTSFFGNDGSQTMVGSEGTSNPITFKTGLNYSAANIIGSGTEQMRITAGGNVGIGVTGPGYKLTVAGIIAPSADNTYSLGGSTTAARWTAVYATNGTIQTSDRRLKTNIKPLNYGLKEVLALQPVSYNWKEKPTTNPKIGLIAQDVKKLVPEVVTGDEAKEKLGMNYGELVPVLINAIKEQQKEIDDLKNALKKLQK